MSRAKHTPEPWHTYSHDGTLIGAAASDYALANLGSDHRADAARIVDCVNAMAGVADPAGYVERVKALIRTARELEYSATRLPDDTEDYAPIDRAGRQRGEYSKRTDAAYVVRHLLNKLQTALAAFED